MNNILKDGRLVSRLWQAKTGTNFVDISIDPGQPVRKHLRLLDYIPLFPGYYQLYRSYELNGYLSENYDDPKVQNKSFYGTLNRVLQSKDGIKYGNIVILLIKDKCVYNSANNGGVRIFSDIAVKRGSQESKAKSKADLLSVLKQQISQSNISGEIDVYDNGKSSIAVLSEIEAIIVDNEKVKSAVSNLVNSIGSSRPPIFVDALPRNDPGESELF